MKISILVPVYSSQFLPSLIESVINQSYSNWELVLVNDGSPDDAWSIIQKYAQNEKRILGLNQQNQGMAVALNFGLKSVTGDYTLIMGHDDCLSSDLLSHVSKCAHNTNADIISPEVDFYFNTSHPLKWYSQFNIDRSRVYSGVEAFEFTFPWVFHGWNFYRTEMMKTIGFPTFTKYNPDEFAYRAIMLISKSFVFCEGYYKYRYNPISVTNKCSLRLFDVLITDKCLYELAMESKCNTTILDKVLYEYYNNCWKLINTSFLLEKIDQKTAFSMLKQSFNYIKSLGFRLKKSDVGFVYWVILYYVPFPFLYCVKWVNHKFKRLKVFVK